jgi:hypothetical protein
MPKTPKTRKQDGDGNDRELRPRGQPYPVSRLARQPKVELPDEHKSFDSSQVLSEHDTVSASQESLDLLAQEGRSNGSSTALEQTSHIGDVLRHLGTRADHERLTTNETMSKGFSWIASCLDDFAEKLHGHFTSKSNPHLLLKQLDDTIEQKEAAEKTIVQLKQQKEAAEKTIAQLKQQKEAADNAVVQLRQDLEKSNERLEKARRERDAQRRIAEGGTLANSTKVTDDAIKSQWTQLRYNIRSLARYLGSMDHLYVTNHMKSRFRAVSTEWHAKLWEEATREFMWEGYLWTMVRQQIIRTAGGEWAGNRTKFLKFSMAKLLGNIVLA